MWGAAPWRRSPRRMTAQSGSLRRRSGSGRRRSWGALRPWQHRSFRYPRRRESSPTPTSWPPDTTDAKESTDVPEAKPEANAEMKPGALELSEETRGRLAELRALSEKAEAGDKGAPARSSGGWYAPPLRRSSGGPPTSDGRRYVRWPTPRPAVTL